MSALPLSVPPAKSPGAYRRSRTKTVVVLLAILLVAWAIIAWFAPRLLIVTEQLDHADAIVVFSGAVTFDERAQLAATLYKEGRAPKIVLTNDNLQAGWSNQMERNPYYWEYAVRELRGVGVPRERIEVLPQPVRSTYDEAVLFREYCEARGLRSILAVTSAYHTRRAWWTLRHVFQGSGIAIGMAAVPPGLDSPSPATWWLHRRGWRMVAGEYLKMIYYALSY